MSEPNKLDPTPGLPDDTLISDVEFPARVRKVLTAVGLKTVGEAVGKAFDREKAYDWLNCAIDDGRAEYWHVGLRFCSKLPDHPHDHLGQPAGKLAIRGA